MEFKKLKYNILQKIFVVILVLLIVSVMGITQVSCVRLCISCDGSGDCRFCNGFGGEYSFIFGEYHYVRCGICNGSGTCTRCNGDGRL
ncbi:MAG: hypothetical protein FWC91_14730 [Defluviitaleaceae bacterium]|nr:hypothetical protein [Defluviitaleaceae bacterium]